MNFFKEAVELPSREEQLKLLQEKSERLEEELKRFNLPEDLPTGGEFLPEHLTADEKAEILRIWKSLEEIESRRQFLENPDEFKK